MSRHSPARRGVRGAVPLTLALTAMVAVTLVAVPALAGHGEEGAGVETTTHLENPVVVPGNDTGGCANGEFEFKIQGGLEDVGTRTYTDPVTGTDFVITVRQTDDGNVFDFEIVGGSTAAVHVKGGPDFNLYDYFAHEDDDGDDPAAGTLVSADTGLHSPENPNNDKFYGLSHITFCYDTVGALVVEKFIDVDADGVLDTADVTSGDANLAGWEFEVYAGSDTSGTLIDTLTTDNDGQTDTIELPAGTYTVLETNTGKTITTDVTGGSTTEVTTDNPQSDDVVSGETTTYTFGNACLITKTFAIAAAPDTENVTAFYDTNLDDDAISSDAEFVALSDTDGDGTFTGTAPDLFQIGDQIEWGFGVDTDGDGSLADEDPGFIAGISDETFVVADGYPSCLRENQATLDNPQIQATKFKDADDDGDPADLDGELDGWTIELYDSTGTTLLDSGVTGDDGDGTVLFEDLTVGASYVVCEDLASEPDWLQTYPTDTDTIVSPDDCHEVGPLEIDETVEVEFLNSPLSELRVGFTDLTGSTDATIVCTVPDGDDADSEPDVVYSRNTASDAAGEDFDDIVLDDHRLRQGDVTCVFDVVDP